LIFVGAGIPEDVRMAIPVSLVDIMPTSLAHLGVPIPAALDGIDLHPFWSDPDAEPVERLLFLDVDRWAADTAWRAEGFRSAVRSGRFKLQHDRKTGESRFFDLDVDPLERVDATTAHPELSAQLFESLERYLAETPASPRSEALTAEEQERLESLGYLR